MDAQVVVNGVQHTHPGNDVTTGCPGCLEALAEMRRQAARTASDPERAVAAERARIRRELLETLDAWTEGASPTSLRGTVAKDLRAALDRICPEGE